MTPRYLILTLATISSLVLVAMSAVAGWQRGGTVTEQSLFVALSCVLTVTTHVTPSLIRGKFWVWPIWIFAFCVCIVNHVAFFTFAEAHRSQPVTTQAEIARGITEETRKLARRPTEERREVVQALKTELEIAKEAQRDPIGNAISRVTGVSNDAVTAWIAVVTAVTLECLAVMLWALGSIPITRESNESVTKASEPSQDVTPPLPGPVWKVEDCSLPESEPVTPESPITQAVTSDVTQSDQQDQDDLVTQLKADIAAGKLKPTVAGIRNHLGVGQKRAMELRNLVTSEASSN